LYDIIALNRDALKCITHLFSKYTAYGIKKARPLYRLYKGTGETNKRW
jgi:hypothetical protein